MSIWSYANPQGKDPSKELCDVLIICDLYLAIISVKEREYSDSQDDDVSIKRWQRRTIDNSVKQIYGAERWLQSQSRVIRSDGSEGLIIPQQPDLNVIRIAIALGSEGKLPYYSGNFGKGYVHVFDDISFEIVLKELDTINDFLSYPTLILNSKLPSPS